MVVIMSYFRWPQTGAFKMLRITYIAWKFSRWRDRWDARTLRWSLMSWDVSFSMSFKSIWSRAQTRRHLIGFAPTLFYPPFYMIFFFRWNHIKLRDSLNILKMEKSILYHFSWKYFEYLLKHRCSLQKWLLFLVKPQMFETTFLRLTE